MIRSGLAGLAACDVEQRDAGDLGAECEELLRAVGALQLLVARRLGRFAALGGPAADGASSPSAWLAHHARLRPWEARQLVVMATRLPLLDESVAAFEAEEIGFGDVATIAEGVDKAADTMSEEWTPERVAEAAQPILIEAATALTPGRLRKVAAQIALVLDGDSAEKRRRQIDRQAFLELGQTMDGIGSARADMGAADFAILEKAVDTFSPKPDADAPHWCNLPGRRRLRGLITACEIALGAAGAHGYRERGGAPVRVHLIATQATADPDVPVSAAPPGRTEFGTILSATQVREMISRRRARVSTVHVLPDGSVADRFTAEGRPLIWGRTKRIFTTDQRDVYLALYAACTAEGCDRPLAWSAIDHKVEWASGGCTDLLNGQPLCDWHNLHKEHSRVRRPGNRRPSRRSGRGDGRAESDDPPQPAG